MIRFPHYLLLSVRSCSSPGQGDLAVPRGSGGHSWVWLHGGHCSGAAAFPVARREPEGTTATLGCLLAVTWVPHRPRSARWQGSCSCTDPAPHPGSWPQILEPAQLCLLRVFCSLPAL